MSDKLDKLKGIMVEGKIYGIPVEELSYRQARHAFDFARKVEPWLRDNIGEFDGPWTVVQDNGCDRLRIMFRDERDETYFRLAWMHRDHETDPKS